MVLACENQVWSFLITSVTLLEEENAKIGTGSGKEQKRFMVSSSAGNEEGVISPGLFNLKEKESYK